MNSHDFVNWLEDASYGFLVLNFLWGMYCVILIWRRIGQLRFKSIDVETEFVNSLLGHLKSGNYDAAVKQCDYDYRGLPRLCLLMIANRNLPFSQLRQMVSSSLQRTILADLEFRISWIVTVIKNGPLLGLFGTVLGMMAAFARIGTGEKVQPSQIAEDISIALICTAMGLATAIPLGYILSLLNIRVRALQDSLESSVARVLDHFRK